MAARIALRHIARRFSSSSSGKVLHEEEKAAENVYIKKAEREKLEKLARKASQQGEQPASSIPLTADGKPASTTGLSSDQNRNYAVIAGAIAAAAAAGWYFLSKPKKSEEESK